MKTLDLNKLGDIKGQKLQGNDVFSFRCHPDVECFNRCCRNLNLFLYPYDVLRLKNRLEISSEQFIEQYVDIVMRPDNFFPDVLLSMADNAEKTCSFLTEAGCSVYTDRPDTCRTYPVEQGVLFDGDRTEFVYFFRPAEFCRGASEERQWTIDGWLEDQHAMEYKTMTARWAKLKSRFQNNPWGAEGPEGPKAKMAFMSAYNIDRFHDFVFHSSFLKRYKVPFQTLQKLKKSETKLMEFSFDWIGFFLWGIPSKHLKPR